MRRPTTTAAMKLEVLRRVGVIVPCAMCQSAIEIKDVHFDHWLALVDDGEHTAENLRPTCFSCNSQKGAVEHKNNSKAKRLSKARQAHDAIVKREAEKPAGKIKSRGFDKTLTKRFDGKVVAR